MKFALLFRLAASAFFSFFLVVGAARAAGSLSREEFLQKISDERLRQYVAEHFDLAEEGRSLRAGMSLPNAGERLPPYEIVAYPCSGARNPVVLHLDSGPSSQIVILPCAGSDHYDRDCQ